LTSERERQVLEIIAVPMSSPATPESIVTWMNARHRISIGTQYAREVATYLTGKGLASKHRARGLVNYTITDAGRRELDGDGN
jgi:predicted transcriptional regulator